MFKRREQPGWMAVVPRKTCVDLADVVREGDRPRVERLDSAPRAAGTPEHVLQQLRRSHGLQRHRCTTWIEPGAYQVVQVASPRVEAAELRAALRWSVKDALDFPVEQAVVDVLPIPADGMPAGREPLALVAAARRERLQERVQSFQAARLVLAALDITEAAQRNIATLFEDAGRGIAMLGLYEHGGLLTFSRGGELYGLRHIELNLAAFADAEQRAAVFERLGLELQRSLDGFDRQFSQVPLSRLLIAGHPASEAFANFLKDNLYLPVDVADLTTVLELGRGAQALADVSGQHAWYAPIGLALRRESGDGAPQNLNFYDPALKARREWATAPNAAMAVGACALAVGLGAAWSHHELSQLKGPAADTQAALEAAQGELTELTQRATEVQPDAALQAQVQLAQASVTQRQAALELLRAGGLGDTTGHAGALAAFARQSLNGLWLTGVVLDHGQIALRGRSLDPELIPAYVSRLNREAALQGRSFRALQIERPLMAATDAATDAARDAAKDALTDAPSAPPRNAPYVEFSLVSAEGAEAPVRSPEEARP